jgi:hypothetical protein
MICLSNVEKVKTYRNDGLKRPVQLVDVGEHMLKVLSGGDITPLSALWTDPLTASFS